MTCNCKGNCFERKIKKRIEAMEYTLSGRVETLELVESVGRLAEATRKHNREDISRALSLIYLNLEQIAYQNKLKLKDCIEKELGQE